jgi:hypothetical protein
MIGTKPGAPLRGRPRADFHVAENQLGGLEDAPVARVRAALILLRDDGAVDVEEMPPGMNRIARGLQVGGVGLGQRPRGGDLAVFAAVGRQNGQQVRHELMITGHGVLHGSFPLARRNQRIRSHIALRNSGRSAATVRFVRFVKILWRRPWFSSAFERISL